MILQPLRSLYNNCFYPNKTYQATFKSLFFYIREPIAMAGDLLFTASTHESKGPLL
ncbi:hypothetical protein SynMEDNS5_02181 [Synechococcus sp. MEDNS5]|nr:hypothetical protein SynMEDNS5_02181 [Synechococcus sp. MEDNS5]